MILEVFKLREGSVFFGKCLKSCLTYYGYYGLWLIRFGLLTVYVMVLTSSWPCDDLPYESVSVIPSASFRPLNPKSPVFVWIGVYFLSNELQLLILSFI